MIKCPDLPEKTLLRPDEVAEFFSVSAQTIYMWCDSGTLDAIKVNGTTRIYRQSVLRVLQKGDPLTVQRQVQPGEKKRRVLSKGI